MVSLSGILLDGLERRGEYSMRRRFDMARREYFKGWAGVPLVVDPDGSVSFMQGVESDAAVQMRYDHPRARNYFRSVQTPTAAQQNFIDRVARLDPADPQQRILAYTHPSMSPTEQDIDRAVRAARETGERQFLEPVTPPAEARNDPRYSDPRTRERLERSRYEDAQNAERMQTRRVDPDDPGRGNVVQRSRDRSNPLGLPPRGEPAPAPAPAPAPEPSGAGTGGAGAGDVDQLYTAFGDEILDDGSIRLPDGRVYAPGSEAWDAHLATLTDDEVEYAMSRVEARGGLPGPEPETGRGTDADEPRRRNRSRNTERYAEIRARRRAAEAAAGAGAPGSVRTRPQW